MRIAPIATILLGAVSLIGGSYLILSGIIQWIGGFGLVGLFPIAPMGAFFTFLSLPIALYGFKSLPRWLTGISGVEVNREDEEFEEEALFLPLFSNKRIMGFSLAIAGICWMTFSAIGLQLGALSVACPVYAHCPRSIFGYSLSWIIIGIGAAILAVGIFLILRSKSSELRDQLRKSDTNMLQTNRLP